MSNWINDILTTKLPASELGELNRIYVIFGSNGMGVEHGSDKSQQSRLKHFNRLISCFLDSLGLFVNNCQVRIRIVTTDKCYQKRVGYIIRDSNNAELILTNKKKRKYC